MTEKQFHQACTLFGKHAENFELAENYPYVPTARAQFSSWQEGQRLARAGQEDAVLALCHQIIRLAEELKAIGV